MFVLFHGVVRRCVFVFRILFVPCWCVVLSVVAYIVLVVCRLGMPVCGASCAWTCPSLVIMVGRNMAGI